MVSVMRPDMVSKAIFSQRCRRRMKAAMVDARIIKLKAIHGAKSKMRCVLYSFILPSGATAKNQPTIIGIGSNIKELSSQSLFMV